MHIILFRVGAFNQKVVVNAPEFMGIITISFFFPHMECKNCSFGPTSPPQQA